MLTYLTLLSVRDTPVVRLDWPSPLKVGDRLSLRFTLKRKNKGRLEAVVVTGDYQVTETHGEQRVGSNCQTAQVTALGQAPPWKAIKTPKRRLPLAVQPRQAI